ncbi:uncharacterized protein LOC141885856 [Acropora palmata]|uniref:uncharacterized protein LOC141885856 n=1 Tax=Acropora palmata TaxID=6131 RepID=UPI003DA020F0
MWPIPCLLQICSGRNIGLHHIGSFYTRGRIIHLDELGQAFVIRLVIRLTGVCKDTRSDCEAVVGSFPSNFVCEIYRGQCDRWCGFCSQIGALQRCSDVFPVSRCLFALKTLQCRRNENIGRCRKTCCDCDDNHRNCV